MATQSGTRGSSSRYSRKTTPENEHKIKEMERLREEYLKRMREEKQREQALRDGGVTLEVTDVELFSRQNSLDHNTSRFRLLNSNNPPAILRRGQPFNMNVQFNRNYDLSQDKIKLVFSIGTYSQVSKGTLLKLPVTDNKSFTRPNSQWDVLVSNQEPKTIHLQVQISSKAIVGIWHLSIETSHPSNSTIMSFSANKDIYILFNPWCKDDSVYMEDEVSRNEYVLSESGKIYCGTYSAPKARAWIYGQFSSVALTAAISILEASALDFVGRANPVKVTRIISAMINSEDDNGILKGKWQEPYDKGTEPWVWSGSKAILEEYLQNGNTVKYGQCWVFAGICTTICRALGIPCRPVTNFVSAHDTDDTLTIDKFFGPKGEEMDLTYDSIWNYHVWNDCWMTRPDLPPGYGGWQAVDATPQETSEGLYRTGPASLEAVRRGEVGFLYDSPFVFSEVNADIVHWQKDDDLIVGWKKLQVLKYSVGRLILTKKAGVYDHRGIADAEDITKLYKNSENTLEERIAIRKAATYGAYAALFDMPLSKEREDMSFDLLDIDQIMIGEPFDITMNIENRSNEIRTVFAVLSANSVYYTGIKAHSVKKEIGKLIVNPGQKETWTVRVTGQEYYDKLVDYSMMKIYAMTTVKETNQTWTEEDDFAVEKPKLELEVSGNLRVGQPFGLIASFTNPLDRTLHHCKFIVEGPELSETYRFPYRNIDPKETITFRETFVPFKEGKEIIVVIFSSYQMIDVQGSIELEVLP